MTRLKKGENQVNDAKYFEKKIKIPNRKAKKIFLFVSWCFNKTLCSLIFSLLPLTIFLIIPVEKECLPPPSPNVLCGYVGVLALFIF
jgi:hypothetical protein